MPTIRVLLVEDNRLLRDGALAMLNAEADIRAISIPSVEARALERAKVINPHVVLLDLGQKTENTFNMLTTIRTELPTSAIVVMALFPAQENVVDLVKIGVSGFILKDTAIDEFYRTIRVVAKGEKVLPGPLTDSVFTQIVDHAISKNKPEQLAKFVQMTLREQEVVDLISLGRSNREIAGALDIAVYTVKSHVHNILKKLALHTRLELASYSLSRERKQGSPAWGASPTATPRYDA